MTPEEKNDAFYTTIEFGTAGMRGLLGPGTNRINIHTIRKATQGFAEYIKEHGEKACEEGIAIGYDNRHMSRELAFDCADLLAKTASRPMFLNPCVRRRNCLLQSVTWAALAES